MHAHPAELWTLRILSFPKQSHGNQLQLEQESTVEKNKTVRVAKKRSLFWIHQIHISHLLSLPPYLHSGSQYLAITNMFPNPAKNKKQKPAWNANFARSKLQKPSNSMQKQAILKENTFILLKMLVNGGKAYFHPHGAYHICCNGGTEII